MHEIPRAERALGDIPQPRSQLERLTASLALAAYATLSLAANSAARADVVYIPDAPTDCPEGSTGGRLAPRLLLRMAALRGQLLRRRAGHVLAFRGAALRACR